MTEFSTEHQIWACDWSAANDYHVYLGTQKGKHNLQLKSFLSNYNGKTTFYGETES